MKGFVYFLGYEPLNLVKIGSSFSPKDRLRTYQAWSPVPITLICTIPGDGALERNIQNCFADYHSHHEWFFRRERLDAAIHALLDGSPIEDAMDLSDVRGNVLGNIQRATMARNGTRPGWAAKKAFMASRAPATSQEKQETAA